MPAEKGFALSVVGSLKDAVKRVPVLYRVGRRVSEWHRRRREAASWTASYLSPARKVEELRRSAELFRSRAFVETGTYEAETTYALRRDFDQLYTIELDPELARLARMRLAPQRHITVIEGSGPDGLHAVLGDLRVPALFWLDSHPSSTKTAGAGSPVVDELRQVMAHGIAGHVALIDDVRLFNGRDGWPTIGDVVAVVDTARFDTEVRDDILRVTPKKSDPTA